MEGLQPEKLLQKIHKITRSVLWLKLVFWAPKELFTGSDACIYEGERYTEESLTLILYSAATFDTHSIRSR